MRGDSMSQTNSSSSLANLISSGSVRLRSGAPLGLVPWAQDGGPDKGRWRGMYLGLAIGDGLGNTSESMLPAQRRARHGEIRHYLPNRHASGRRVGLPSDDTQLCAWAVEQIIRDQAFDPDAWLQMVASRQVFGMGSTVSAALDAFAGGAAWTEAAQESAGNGALMRCPGVFAAHLGTDGRGLAADAVLLAASTHNDFAATSSAVAFTLMLAELLTMAEPPPPDWWVSRYAELAAPLEGDAIYEGRGAPAARGYAGPLWRFVADQVPAALTAGVGTQAACDSWFSGAYLLETVPSVLFILARHGTDPAEAIRRAVNDTRDNDTIAAIVGSAVGALHGEDALPEAWRRDLLGRTRENDDGALHALLDQAGAIATARAARRDDAATPVRIARSPPDTDIIDRARGAFLGLAVGDALGTTIEFMARDTYPKLTEMIGGGPFGLEPGQWTDDTSMALALADSLIANPEFDPADLMDRFLRWWVQGEYSCTGQCFDIGITTREALTRYQRTRSPFAGATAENKAGNGSLMRLSPVALHALNDADRARRIAAEQSRTTHGAPQAIEACVWYADLLRRAVLGEPLVSLLAPGQWNGHPAMRDIVSGSWRGRERGDIRSSGYVIHTLEAALWAVEQTDSFEEALVLAVNLGDDADTVGAVTGQLAGAVYGVGAIPARWMAPLAWRQRLSQTADALVDAGWTREAEPMA